MAKLIFLGTAYVLAYDGHENTYLVIQGDQSSILVDCAAKPVQRLKEAGVSFNDLSDLIITHFHPDHVAGLPNLLMDMWLMGREKEFHIHGCEHAISRAQKMMELFDLQEWNGMYPIHFHTVPLEELTPVINTPEFRILTSPVEHMIPTLGLRVEYQGDRFIVAYSSDTRPVPQTVKLAADADVLIHEATGSVYHHSTASEAGEIAMKANAKSLYLVHYGFYDDITPESMLSDAKTTFPGKVVLAEDLMEIEFKKD